MARFFGIGMVLAMIMMCGYVQAEDTTGANYEHPAFGGLVGEVHEHSHGYTDSYQDKYGEYQKEQNFPIGVGMDVILYQPEGLVRKYTYVDSVNLETKWDLANKSGDVYFVTHVNLWSAIKDLTR